MLFSEGHDWKNANRGIYRTYFLSCFYEYWNVYLACSNYRNSVTFYKLRRNFSFNDDVYAGIVSERLDPPRSRFGALKITPLKRRRGAPQIGKEIFKRNIINAI